MAYGMSYEQFWYEDPWMVRAFAQTFLLKQKLRNEYAWIQGAYIANAFASVLPEAHCSLVFVLHQKLFIWVVLSLSCGMWNL